MFHYDLHRFETFSKNVTVDGTRVFLGLWSTAGQENYANIRSMSYPETVYDTTLLLISNNYTNFFLLYICHSGCAYFMLFKSQSRLISECSSQLEI